MSSLKVGPDSSHTHDGTLTFLRKTYREYYFKHHDDVEIPTLIWSREFGYIPFGKGMIRHLSYKSPGELAADLVKQAPSSVYCSNATYSNPTLPMDDKGWKGAELIFDIDANSIPTACRTKHSFWICKACGKVIRSTNRPEECSKCKGTGAVQLHWSCAECLTSTREHVYRLIGFLTKDFGVSEGNIAVYFSGNRGYHLHVQDERFEAMDPSARAQVANYIKGAGLIRPQGSDRSQGGWIDRVVQSAATSQSRSLDQVINTFSSRIDESVTTDIHRIFRLPGTLHGNSGLLKMRVHNLQDFRPDYDPVVLGEDEVTVSIHGAPTFELRGNTFGPYSSQDLSLPTYAAVYLMTKGLARLVD